MLSWPNISNNSMSTSKLQDEQKLLTTQLIQSSVLRHYQLICYGICSEAIVLFGIGTNTINIICFVKQGFKESINISLLSLAVSDLGCLITMLWIDLCLVPQFQEADLPFDPMDTQYLIAALPHVTFTRVTGVITAFITLERCLCITMPLKVARLVTPKRVAVINVCIFTAILISAIPVYFSGRIAMKYFPEKNKTILGIIFTEDRVIIEQISFALNSVLVPFTALLITVFCMIAMVIALQKQTKWRMAQCGAKKMDTTSERERRLVKMIVMISTLFVSCFCPSALLFLCVLIEPGFNYGGKYFDITVLAYGFSNIAETTNSSMNIIIYYKMSSRYRACFRQLFCLRDVNTDRKDGAAI